MTEDPNSSILRGIRTLMGLAEAGKPVSFGVLAEALQMPPSTTHRILSALRQAGYAVQDPATGSYSPGSAFLRAATLFSASTTFPHAIRSNLAKVVDESGESAYYGIYLGEKQRFKFLLQVFSEHAIHYVVRKDKDYSLLWGASGRSIAAYLPESVVNGIYSRESHTAEGNEKLPALKVLQDELIKIKKIGYSTTNNQRFDGAHSIAAPVIGMSGMAVGCIGISMPSIRRDESKIDQLAKLVKDTAFNLSLVAQCAVENPSLD
ncbi:MAG: hypothetical protein JWR68_885 [Polaromonas sp.]|nr:hypothetical protein [Polaromonas sp.]